MSHTDYINYLNNVKLYNTRTISDNNDSINALTSAIQAYNDQITATQQQIQGFNDNNTTLTNDNTIIDAIIALL